MNAVGTPFSPQPLRSSNLPAWESKFDPRACTSGLVMHHAIDLLFGTQSLLIFRILFHTERDVATSSTTDLKPHLVAKNPDYFFS